MGCYHKGAFGRQVIIRNDGIGQCQICQKQEIGNPYYYFVRGRGTQGSMAIWICVKCLEDNADKFLVTNNRGTCSICGGDQCTHVVKRHISKWYFHFDCLKKADNEMLDDVKIAKKAQAKAKRDALRAKLEKGGQELLEDICSGKLEISSIELRHIYPTWLGGYALRGKRKYEYDMHIKKDAVEISVMLRRPIRLFLSRAIKFELHHKEALTNMCKIWCAVTDNAFEQVLLSTSPNEEIRRWAQVIF
jgi:hypothetical protein